LRRIARLEQVPMRPIIPSPAPYAYRNRVTVHADDGVVGYYRYNTHRLLDVTHCPIAAPEVNRALAELRQRRPREGHYTLRARPGPRVFQQTNDAVAEALAGVVSEMLPETSTLLVDAYCGAGFFTKRFQENFERVVGIEWDRHAVAAAQSDATAHERYIAGDVEVELERELSAAESTRTAVIVDPPATGLSEGVRRVLAEYAMQTLIYVSCNPATLARDLKELVEQYELLSVTPLDMFPQTAEIECVAHLKAKPQA
jgi:23S rRNA (uracil1939-C5)-methyltransferase